MGYEEVIILIVSGIFVGFINTLAGGGSVISLSVFMIMGLPPAVANGTNRVAILIQTLTAVGSFKKQKVLDHKKAFLLAIPASAGALIGALVAVDIEEEIFQKVFAVIMLIMLVFILYKPQKYLYGKKHLQVRKISVWQVLIFFVIGLYGGFIHVGVGYFLLAGIVLSAGYDLVKANAIKVTIALIFTIVAFLVFLFEQDIQWLYGLLMAAGTIIGALIASKMAVTRGVNFVRWVIVVLILVFSAHFFNLFDINELFSGVLKK